MWASVYVYRGVSVSGAMGVGVCAHYELAVGLILDTLFSRQ